MSTAADPSAPGLIVSADDGGAVIRPSGSWVVARIVEADALVPNLITPAGRRVSIDLSAVDQIDTSGVMVLVRLRKRLEFEGRSVDIAGATERQLPLFEAILPLDVSPLPLSEKSPSLIRVMEDLGRNISTQFAQYGGAIDLLGRTVQALARAVFSPRRLRITSIFHHMKVTGFDAVPISCLLTFLIGAVVAFLCIDMLELFGAGGLTVNIMGFALLRELGVLLVAIVVAGRSGSAFTAQIGSMRTHEGDRCDTHSGPRPDRVAGPAAGHRHGARAAPAGLSRRSLRPHWRRDGVLHVP